MARALTAKTVENLKPDPTKRLEVPDPGLTGLYLIVQPSGAKSWAVRYRHAGKPRKVTLGRWPVLSLSAARMAASVALQAVELGRDPSEEKKRLKAENAHRSGRDTISNLVEQFDRRHLSKLKRGAEARRVLDRFMVEAWGERDIQSITRRDVIGLLDEIMDSGRATTANRTKAYMSKFFNWAASRDIIEIAPTLGVKAPAKENQRSRFLSDDEIRLFWKACERAGPPWEAFGKLLLLTGQRRSEVSEMTDAEIDGDIWHLAADRTKNGHAHDVPLSDAAMNVLAGVERVRGSAGFLHTTTGDTPVSGLSKARDNIAKHMKAIAEEERGEGVEIEHWVWHDLRRTAETGMARLKIPQEIIDRVANHISGQHRMARTYNQHAYLDEKRTALEAWAQFVEELVSGEAGEKSNVVRLEGY